MKSGNRKNHMKAMAITALLALGAFTPTMAWAIGEDVTSVATAVKLPEAGPMPSAMVLPPAPAVEAVPASGLMPASAAPAVAPANPTAKDPVYEAWQEFLKQRPDLENKGVAKDDTSFHLSAVRGDAVQQGSLGTGSWGSLVATMFGGVTLAGAYMARKKTPRIAGWLRSRGGARKERTRVQVISVSPLSSQGSIAVVEVCGEVLVLGVTAGRVSLLTRMNETGRALPAPVEEEEEDLVKPQAPAPRASSRSRVENDFDHLLGNLMDQSEAPMEPVTPMGRYAAMSSARREASFEPPPEDMAGQVLRKMKTMKRFRSAV